MRNDHAVAVDADDDRVDFEKTFIQCIVYNFEVLKEVGDEAGVKAAGKILTKGKDYVVRFFLASTWSGC